MWRYFLEHIMLSEGEWKIMKLMWESSPRTLREITTALEAETGWTRPTIHVMLKRLIVKGAVRVDETVRIHEYYPLIKRKDVAPEETESFLNRVYDGSVGMLFSALTERKSLSSKEIAELRQILDHAEKNRKE